MCKFNEDEIIKYANNIINATFIEATLQDKDGNIIEQGLVNKDVIQGLLDLYQKEKEKNKELQELYTNTLKDWCVELANDLIYYKNLAKEYQGNCISKDEIRKCIQTPYPEVAVENIVELLEENNGE